MPRARCLSLIALFLGFALVSAPGTASGPSAPSDALQRRSAVESTLDGLMGQWWLWLVKVRPQEGCSIDPNGHCGNSPPEKRLQSSQGAPAERRSLSPHVQPMPAGERVIHPKS
jgi:hypothetical protein